MFEWIGQAYVLGAVVTFALVVVALVLGKLLEDPYTFSNVALWVTFTCIVFSGWVGSIIVLYLIYTIVDEHYKDPL